MLVSIYTFWKGLPTSKKMNIKTVFGPRRTKAGVQPLKRNLGPSSRRAWRRTWIEDF